MRALVAAAALAVLLAPLAAAKPIGFDHAIHDGKVVAGGAETPACATCHKKAPAHPSCFTSGCHTMPKKGGAAICQSCHADADPRAAPKAARKAFYPPYGLDRDWSTSFAHDAHAGRTGCETCHGTPGDQAKPRPAPHAACATCHATATQPTMDRCEGCHRQIAGRDVTPRSERGPYAVVFSHGKVHLGAPCATCHAEVATTPGERVPSPRMIACESCHDGRKAFSAVAPTCRRCHTRDDRTLPSDAPVVLFSHRRHADRGLRTACTTCHAGPDGGAARDHMPCASTDCHASEFRAARPTICGACHVGTEPWRPLRADRPRRVRTELGVELSHAGHQASDCAACHTGAAGSGEDRVELRLANGHASCDPCHAKTAPTMDACDGCHVLGLLDGRDARRRTAPWSVAKTFRHATHQTECAACHTSVAVAATIADIAPPEKRTCAPCHDGAKAFKMTGHGCARCHAK